MYNIHPFNAQDSTQRISFSAGHIDAPYAQVMTVDSGGGVPRTDFGDGFATATTVIGNAIADTGHFFQNGQTSNTVSITVARLDKVKEWQYFCSGLNDGIIGEVDVSKLTNLWDEFTVTGHQNLTGITMPSAVTTNQEFILFRVQNNDLHGTLQLSGFTNFGRTSPDDMGCQFFGNPNLTAVTFPATSKIINLNGRTCDFRHLDFTPMTAIRVFIFNQNENLTGVTFTDSGNTVDIVSINFSECGFYDLDFTPLAERMGGSIELQLNPNLSAVTFPYTDLATQINIRNCGFQPDYTVDLTPLRNLGTSIIIRSNNYGDIIFPSTENQITDFQCRDMNELKHFDISPLSGINTSIQPLNSENLTGITFSDAYLYEVTGFNVTACDIRENLDLTKLGDKLSNFIYWRQNVFLTGITFPPSPLGINDIQGWSCGSITDVDFSPLSGYGGNIQIYSCGNLTAITLSETTGTTTNIEFQNNDLSTLDFTPLGNSLAGDIRCDLNSNLNSVTFPITTGTVTSFKANDCDLGFIDFRPLSAGTQDGITINLDDNSTTFAECNQILDSISGMGAQNGSLYLSGDSASITGAEGYDTSSGGINGFAIYSDLINNSGWTIFMSGLTS